MAKLVFAAMVCWDVPKLLLQHLEPIEEEKEKGDILSYMCSGARFRELNWQKTNLIETILPRVEHQRAQQLKKNETKIFQPEAVNGFENFQVSVLTDISSPELESKTDGETLLFRASTQTGNPVLFQSKLTEVSGEILVIGFMGMYAIISLLLVLISNYLKGNTDFRKVTLL